MIIDEKKLYELYTDSYYKGTDYKVIENNITGSDVEDGGADHCIIIQDLSTGKFYEGYYTDWDIYDNFELDKNGNVKRCDFDNHLDEVVPVEKTIIVYERKKD